MDIRQLGYFVRVVEFGSFSRAATYLHVAQPALSRQVQNLEVELKERLLIRNGRGVKTTEAGERLLEHARTILDLVGRVYEDMENARTGKAGTVTIGMPGTLSAAISAALIRRLRNELPDANVHVLHGRSTQLQEWLLAGRLDMAVLYDAPSSPMLEIHDLVTEKLYLFSGPGDPAAGIPATLEEIANLPVIIASRPNRVREIVEGELARTGQKLNVLFEIDAVEAMFDLVHSGVGYTVATRRARRTMGASNEVAIRPIIGPELEIKVQIVLRTRRLNNRLHDAAFRILRDLSLDLLKPEPATSSHHPHAPTKRAAEHSATG
ncbi:LysR family transcriptional regulator [Microvirga sp. VF16]|uniref:LysR family transcriptional regulator n=1 Tax=Microvirga sp. VF16 TaxID=2807101 RepID=UPI00193E88B5|nr:LysR substrate-binding domain-containing protein [Microvirga sp. VF16]QRM27616.1 LysR family transcriptional regulator [Microvirga sp. VF16]